MLRAATARRVTVGITQLGGDDSPVLRWRRVGYVRRILNESELPNWPHPKQLPAGGCENLSSPGIIHS